MLTLESIVESTPLRQSLDASVIAKALRLCRGACGRIESQHPVKQHFALESAEKRLHHFGDTANNIEAQTAYSLLFQYHSELLNARFSDFKAGFGTRAWTRDFDVNYLGGRTAFDSPRVHNVPQDGFFEVARQHYLRAERDWAPIEQSHYEAQAKPMAYRYARWAVMNFHLYRLGLERQQCSPGYFAKAISAACIAGNLTVPWSGDFWQVKCTLQELNAWVREHRMPQREDYLRTLDGIRERLNSLHLRRNPETQPPSPE
jgi:hypothetical protein